MSDSPLVPNDGAAGGAAPSPAASPEVSELAAPAPALGAAPSLEGPASTAPPSVVPPSTPWGFVQRTRQRLEEYFLAVDPGFWQAMVPFVVLAIVLFVRLPTTNYIFDEQEALLANPYVNATQGLKFIDAIHRDFWGLPPDRSVGSYRPIPNFLWRTLWHVSKQPFFHHFYNLLFHAANGALLTVVAFWATRRRGLSWLVGAFFVTSAVLTEAVSGIVGIADVLGGLGAVFALVALRLPAWGMPFGVFAALVFGLFCKESALVCVPLVPLAALLLSPLLHPERPARAIRTLLALVGAVSAFVLYVELRRRWFPSPLPGDLSEPLPETATKMQRLGRDFLVWFHQAPLPKDPLNNPLAEADTHHRIAGALRVYWRGLTQVVFPKTLSGDYSFPQEPIPDKLVFPESVLGAAMMVLPLVAALALWPLALVREARARARATFRLARGAPSADDAIPPPTPAHASVRLVGATLTGITVGALLVDHFVLRRRGIVIAWRSLPAWLALIPICAAALGLLAEGGPGQRSYVAPKAPVPLGLVVPLFVALGGVWVVVSYFPHSNIPVVLPTVRAERFWYFPVVGSAFVLAALVAWAAEVVQRPASRWVLRGAVGAFFLFQCVQAYRHAMDYRDDLTFWEATKKAVPNSAKAHLNFSVMKGARNDLATRLTESQIAAELAPKWAMAHVYTGDTLCRMKYPDRAWPHYKKGFEIGPNELSLIALALQCLYDEGKLGDYDTELRALAEAHPGSWIAYLAVDTLDNKDKNKGVDPKYRPRGYNEGPKDEATE